MNLFKDFKIRWIHKDAIYYEYPTSYYDVIICYGLIHCLKSESVAEMVISALQKSLKQGGEFILVSFNDGSHDLSAHPGFDPLLLKHGWFIKRFENWHIESVSDSILFETHPHNDIPHHHSLTRLRAVKP